jgi:hypothetical protein
MISKNEKEKIRMLLYKLKVTAQLLENIKPNEFPLISERLLTLIEDFEREILVDAKSKTVLELPVSVI